MEATQIYQEAEFNSEQLPSILVIDDEANNFEVIEALLINEDYILQYVSNGADAIASLDLFNPDIILLDVMMPGLNGIEVCQKIRSLEKWATIPIIMVTALQRKEDLKDCLDAGANDFISKPLSGLELRARVKSMLRIQQQYQALKGAQARQLILEAEKVKLLESRNSELEIKVNERTAEIKAKADVMQHRALHDSLTNLPNRTYFLEQIEARINAPGDPKNCQYAVIFLDVDFFKVINDSLGHFVGDQILKQIASKLKSHLSDQDFLARFSGDEFFILRKNFSHRDDVIQLAEEILEDCKIPYIYQKYQLLIHMSLGIVFGNSDYHDADTLIRDADIALYQAKAEGRGIYKIFDSEMHLKAVKRLEIETELSLALEKQEFHLFYQPIIDIGTEALIGFEALVRWQHPQKGIVSPADFIPIAEETGLITALDSWVFQAACQQLSDWKSQYQLPDTFQISINLSVKDLRQDSFLEQIDQTLEKTGLGGESINLEITESIIIEDINWVSQILTELRKRQIQVSIDDFGTGYSSLNYLHRLPVDHLKIDRSFVNQMEDGERNAQVVKTILSLSKNLGLSTVAEGIETREQLQMLQQLGCEMGQGYFFSKPLDPDATAHKWLEPGLVSAQ